MASVGASLSGAPLVFAQSNQPIVYTYNSSSPPHAPASDNFGHSFSYDANGNQTSIVHGSSAVSMSYNHLNKLRSVQNGLAPTVEYRYDNSGTKTAKLIGGVISERYFGLIDIKNGIKTRYYFMGGRRIAERKMDGSGSIQFYQPDHLSSTSLVTNQNGAEVHRADYYEFGAIRKEQGSETKDYAYNDKRRERETDFYDYGARAYAAKFMKFTSPDSIVPNPTDSISLNRYAYVNNNPLKYTDPSGHFAVGLANSLYQKSQQAEHYNRMMTGSFQWITVTPNGDMPVNTQVMPANFRYQIEDRNWVEHALGGFVKHSVLGGVLGWAQGAYGFVAYGLAAMSGLSAVEDAMEGEWRSAALNTAGALPIVGGFARGYMKVPNGASVVVMDLKFPAGLKPRYIPKCITPGEITDNALIKPDLKVDFGDVIENLKDLSPPDLKQILKGIAKKGDGIAKNMRSDYAGQEKITEGRMRALVTRDPLDPTKIKVREVGYRGGMSYAD